MLSLCSVTALIPWTDAPVCYILMLVSYAVVACEIKLFQNYIYLRRRPSKIILFECVKTCLKLFHNFFRGLLQLMNIFQHVHCRRNNFEIISELLQRLNSVSHVVRPTCKIKH